MALRVAVALFAALLATHALADDATVKPDGSTPLQWAAYRSDVAEVTPSTDLRARVEALEAEVGRLRARLDGLADDSRQ